MPALLTRKDIAKITGHVLDYIKDPKGCTDRERARLEEAVEYYKPVRLFILGVILACLGYGLYQQTMLRINYH